MANRRFYQNNYALERELVRLYARVTIGASGAPTLSRGYGITSVARTAQGDYRFTLDDQYAALLHADVKVLSSTAEDITAQVKADGSASATPTVDIYTLAAATATDPAEDDVLLVELTLRNV